LLSRLEAVQFHEQLVQSLVVFTIEGMAAARGSNGIELVDEHDRGRVRPRLFEELPDPGCPEAGEHLHEGGGALHVELRARLARNCFREQDLARTRGTVEEDPFRDARAEPLETARIAQEI